MIFRVFGALLGVFGGLNVLLLILSAQMQSFLSGFRPVATLSDAVLLFGVGAGIWVLGEHKKASSH
jgi:hypothetical protein